MAFNALVIPVMIASPGDVQEERDAVREALHDWNAANSITREVILMPVGWETNSAPDLAGRPQELINDRVLKDCDLLVGIFDAKLGTPTGESESGTVEEIQKHRSAGKPAMVYFSAKPVAPDALDQDQYNKLQEFKSWCQGKGLYETFDDLEEFKQKFTRQLQAIQSQNPYLANMLDAPNSTRSEPMTPELSAEAKTLLIAAASSSDGRILRSPAISDAWFQAGNQTFSGDAREQAKWKRGLEDLVQNGYVEAVGHKGEVFKVTADGYDLFDRLTAE